MALIGSLGRTADMRVRPFFVVHLIFPHRLRASLAPADFASPSIRNLPA